MSSVALAMANSRADFLRAVVPAILPHIGGGEIVPVESVTAEGFVKDLDVLAGVDAWHLVRGRSVMRGIASRVQWPDGRSGYPYETFTVRVRLRSGRETEYHKRERAIAESVRGWLYPHLTVHAYMRALGGDLLCCAVVETKWIIWAIAQGLCTPEIPVKGGNFLRAIGWQKLGAAIGERGARLIRIPKDAQPGLWP